MNALAFLAAGSLQIEFARQEDRIRHSLGLTIDGHFVSVLESIEGNSSQAWPFSPPFQQIVEEKIGQDGSKVLLGVGLSGQGHWSIAVDRPSPLEMQLDVACKNSNPAERLGSRYRWSSHAIMERPDCEEGFRNRKIRWRIQGQTMAIKVMFGSMAIDAESKTIDIWPASVLAESMTHRWCYRIELK